MEMEGDVNSANVNVKIPKRVLHFSDGTIEEFSEDETDQPPPENEKPLVDPKTLTWGPWLAFKAASAGKTTLTAMDSAGEFLAWFFGITTPKYQFEINEYERLEAQKKEMEERNEGWTEQHKNPEELTVEQPPTRI